MARMAFPELLLHSRIHSLLARLLRRIALLGQAGLICLSVLSTSTSLLMLAALLLRLSGPLLFDNFCLLHRWGGTFGVLGLTLRYVGALLAGVEGIEAT